jgi:hypothetical protein
MVFAVLGALGALLLCPAAPVRGAEPSAVPAPGKRTVTGVVVDAAGKAVPGVMVFASDVQTDAVTAMTVSDAEGKFTLSLPRRRHNLGILSPAIGLARLTPRGPGQVEIVTARLPADQLAARPGELLTRIDAPQAYVIRGRVVDEAGGGLEGVRVENVRPTGAVITTVISGAGGQFALLVPGGESRIRTSAPGLEATRSARQDGRLVVVMSIAAEAQRISVTTGRILSFRPGDSVDPEYLPPAPVRAWLQYAYGICQTPGPLRSYEKQNMKKYWYLDVLRRAPPNPASVSGTGCVPPSQYQMPRGQVMLSGFEVWQDAVITDPSGM